MKKIIKLTTLSLIITSTLGFKAGDQIELDHFLNARTSANFTPQSQNVKLVLPKGTKGSIEEFKKFPSGNFGIKMKVENGAQTGKSYWVYYNVKNPALTILDKNSKQQPISKIEKDQRAITKKDLEATRDPSDQLVDESITLTNKTLNSPLAELTPPEKPCDTTPIINNPPPPQPDSKLFNSESPAVAEDQYNESISTAPYREINESQLSSMRCGASGLGYDRCTTNGKVMAFSLTNGGPNKIVNSKEYYINRSFQFEYEDRARSDMKLLIVDSPDDTTSHATYNVMVFLPRSVLPSVKRNGDDLEVTLSTKEIVKFNAITKEITGGVLSEQPMIQEGNKKAAGNRVQYSGTGIVIRSHKSGDLPYGDIEKSDGSSAPSISTATISKKGFKDCLIPAKDIWYTNSKAGGNIFIKPELAADEGMDKFLKARCGFSIF